MSEIQRPIDIVLVRHGQSEANVVVKRQERGEIAAYPIDYVNRHDSEYRLSPEGRIQAQRAGAFVLEHLLDTDTDWRFWTSTHFRAMETAVEMDISKKWEPKRELREREWGAASLLTPEERLDVYKHNEHLRDMNFFYWRPPNGESIAQVADGRVREVLDTVYRECAGSSVLMVTHGEFMWAMRTVLERLHPVEFEQEKDDPTHKIANCLVLHYTRRNPETGELDDRLQWRRAICPWNSGRSWYRGEWQHVPVQRREVSVGQMRRWLDTRPPILED